MIGKLKNERKEKKGGREGGKEGQKRKEGRKEGREGGKCGKHFIIFVFCCKQRSQFTLISSKRLLNSSYVLLLVSS